MAIDALPAEIVRLIAKKITEEFPYTASLASLARTCRYLYAICQPFVYEYMYLFAVPHKLLPAAYTLFTCPHLASAVRSIDLAAHGAAPPLPHRRPTDLPPQPTDRCGWPDVPDLDATLRCQVAAALEGEAPALIDACFAAVRDGTREDLVVMLILMNLEKLEQAQISAMGPRASNFDTRLMFRRAVPRLRKLTTVVFGKYPKPSETWYDDVSRPDLEFSYSLFADLFRLPAITELYIYSIAPVNSCDVPHVSEETCSFFDFIYDIESDNTTLEKLYLSVEAVCNHAHLDHILKHCPVVHFIDFFLPNNRYRYGDGWGWPSLWDVASFQKALEIRADTLCTLGLPDCLHHESATFVDQRAEIDLRALYNLDFLWIHVDWIFSGEDLGMEGRSYDLERNAQRLVSLLPQSIKELCFHLEGDSGKGDESMARAIDTLTQRHGQHNEFRNLEVLDISALTPERLKFFAPSFNLAKANGVPVFLRDRFEWW